MLLVLWTFFSLSFLFASSVLYKLYALFLAFMVLIVTLQLLIGANSLLTVFDYYVSIYRFDFININYTLAFDGLTLYFVFLTALLLIVCLLLAWNLKYKMREFVLVLFFINFFVFNVFAVVDLLLFYIFFESLLIPMFFLIGIWGSRERKINAAYQFFLYTLFGSIFMLISVFFIYSHYGVADFRVFLNFSITLKRQLIFWLFFFIAIAVKVPMFPVHIWLPEAHVEAPTAGSVILAGILLKLGLFALIKFLFPGLAIASTLYAPIVFFLAVVAIIYASCSTLAQIDMKKMVAYSSVAHMNFAVLGMFAFNFYGIIGSVLLMLGHGFVSSGLFLCVGSLYDRYKTRLFIYYGGLIRLMPLFSSMFLLLVLANMSFPGTFNFIGEILIFFSLISVNIALCIVAAVTMIFSAAYSLALYTHTTLGEINGFFVKYFSDFSRREFYMVSILVILTVLFGIFPNLIILLVESNVPSYLDLINVALIT